MGIEAGAQLGSYLITYLIGKGGMGEVYRARDTKLKRDVAIKILPDEFSRDPERVSRFQREAEALAALNHQNIAGIYDLQQSGGTRFLVLEFVEGDTLADTLKKRGALPLDEAFQIAKQICEALEAAHEKGIVHRDLKPANIKLTHDGTVKVLDFGLAKVREAQGGVDLSNSPTLVSASTPGIIMGTAAYMSPEQAKGRPADARSDIWAFGCILYEMLTGKAGFGGETTVEILGEVLKAEPAWTALPAATPPTIRALLRRCLQKDRARRLYAIADARFQIEEALNEPAAPGIPAPVRKSRERIWIAAALAMLAALAVMTALYLHSATADAPEVRLQIATGPAADAASFALSPDGLRAVFQATPEGKQGQLFLRPLGSDTALPLAGTEEASDPFWSPDSRSVGFFAGGQLKRIDVDSGAVQTLTNTAWLGGAWNADGTILFAKSFTSPLFRIPSGGGEATEVTRLEAPQQTSHMRPQFLPDGRHFLFFAYGAPEIRGIYVGSLDSKETRRLFSADAAPVFAPPDYVLFHRQGALVAQRLDLGTLKPVADAVLVSRQVAWNFDQLVASVSASASGLVAYRTSDAERQLVWLDRSGQQVGVVGGPDANRGTEIRLSPDGRAVSLVRTVGGNVDIWVMETALGVPHSFTLDANWNCCPAWSPDGTRLAFATDPKGPGDIYEKPRDGSKPQALLWSSAEDKNLRDWSADGHFLLVTVASKKTAFDLWVLPLDGDKTPFPVAETASSETEGRFSPDGHWIAFQSNDTGQYEVYLQPFPGPGSKRPITSGGGQNPQWGRDGRELFYTGPDGRLMAVSLTPNGSTVEAGKPAALFTLPPQSEFAVSRDGQRFLINKIVKDAAPITILLNWKPPAK